MLKRAATIVGIVFLAIGLLGFVPALTPENSDGVKRLLGIFAVDGLHNFIHIASGLAALAAASAGANASRLYFKVFGVVYAIVTLVGFLQGDTVLGLIPVNLADNLLHLVLATAFLYLGFGKSDEVTSHTNV